MKIGESRGGVGGVPTHEPMRAHVPGISPTADRFRRRFRERIFIGILRSQPIEELVELLLAEADQPQVHTVILEGLQLDAQ